MKSNLGIHIAATLQANQISQLQLSKTIGIRQSTINAIINEGSRPQPDSLAALTGYDWPEKNSGVNLLLEHLRDEIDRARLRESHPKAHIQMKVVVTTDATIDNVIDSLRAHAQVNADVYKLLADLLTLLDDQDQQITKIAADPRASYKTKKPVK